MSPRRDTVRANLILASSYNEFDRARSELGLDRVHTFYVSRMDDLQGFDYENCNFYAVGRWYELPTELIDFWRAVSRFGCIKG
jgi:hypothetical protein